MRQKHRARHAARMLRWPRRVLAICAAMIVVCSCLLPAFANGTDEAGGSAAVLTAAEDSPGPEPDIVPEADSEVPETEPEAEGPAREDDAADDRTEDAAEEPEAASEASAEREENTEEDSTETSELPEKEAEDETPETSDEDPSGKAEEPLLPEDPEQTLPDEDGIIALPEEETEPDAGFSVRTTRYRFWLRELDAYELEELSRDAEAAEMTEAEYLEDSGEGLGLYRMLEVPEGADWEEYRRADPSEVEDPSGSSRRFAGWYTRNELGEKQDFRFAGTAEAGASQTVDVFADWEEDPEEVLPEEDPGGLEEAGSVLPVLSAASYAAERASASGKIKVYVYVATTAKDGSSWAKNEEFLDLLQIDPDTIDGNGYFPVGIISLDRSFLDGKGQAANTPGAPLITNDTDWNDLMDALSAMDTDSMDVSPYTANNGNRVGEYLSQASQDYNRSWGSQRTALFRWNMTESYGFRDQSVQYHLDLQFNTNKIEFITGNNGIDAPAYAKDGTEVDSRTYITGSEIQSPRNLQIPEGYKFMGYYEDADFTIPWDKIGTPLNEDETVYLKITPNANVVLRYVVAEGEGTVQPDNEVILRGVGEAEGSTAEPAGGWTFAGWYLDEACEEPVPEEDCQETHFTPAEPETGWEDAVYYAKFIQSENPVEIIKTVTGQMGERDRLFHFEVTDAAGATHGFSLKHGQSTAEDSTFRLTVKAGDTLTLKETDAEGYSVKAIVFCKDGTTQEILATEELEEAVKTLILPVTEEMLGEDGVRIEVCNDRDTIPDSGVALEAQPYAGLLGAALAGMGVWMVRRRKRHVG